MLGLRLGFFRFIVFWFHRREEEYFLNVVAVCEEHGQPVYTHTPTPSRRQTILQRRAEVLVQEHRLVVPTGLVLGLLLEPGALYCRVVQLGVGVADFLLHDKQLESLGDARLAAVPLGQGGHHLQGDV